MTGPLVSIIVTSYNHADYLGQRMDTLLAQRYAPIEIIVIDDASTDHSLSVLNTYTNDPRVTLVALERNGGYAHACNLGVSMARGEFAMFAECDDYDAPEHVERLVAALSDSPGAGVAFCRSTMVDGDGSVLGTDFELREPEFQNRCRRDTCIERATVQRFLLMACVIPNMSAALFRTELFRKIGGLSPEYQACADWDFWCRMAAGCEAFCYVADALNYFRCHADSVRSSAAISLQVIEMFDLLHKAAAAVPLSALERFRFRCNLGFLWSIYVTAKPLAWLMCFPDIFRGSLEYDRLTPFFLLLGLGRKGVMAASHFLRSPGAILSRLNRQ